MGDQLLKTVADTARSEVGRRRALRMENAEVGAEAQVRAAMRNKQTERPRQHYIFWPFFFDASLFINSLLFFEELNTLKHEIYACNSFM